MQPEREHPREELIELLWPGVRPETGRPRLRQTLSTLKSLLQPRLPGALQVIGADRLVVRVVPGMLDCDVLRFELALRAGDLSLARRLYRGEFMPGFYEDWIHHERQRLAAAAERLMQQAPVRPPDTHMLREVRAAALPDAPATAVPQPLPHYWTRAYGLPGALGRLTALVRTERWVTLLGPGGSGKTRLSVEAARALQSLPAGAAFGRSAFVPLAECRTPEQLWSAIASVLQLPAGGASHKGLSQALALRPTLLVLDNVEHLDRDAGLALAELLAAVPRAHLLLSSRRRLDLAGERVFDVEGLPLPPPGANFQEIAASPGVALFVDRARASRPEFAVTARNAQVLGELVHLLGGMPLAIEMAASRLRSMTPAELLRRMRDRSPGSPMLDLLKFGPGAGRADSRHASMRQALAWSWHQLSKQQASMLQALAAFGSAASFDAVAAVAPMPRHKLAMRLDELRNASMLLVDDGPDGRSRYWLLQPVREYAAEQAGEAPVRTARQRLRRWLIATVRGLGMARLGEIEPQLPHVLDSIDSAAADGDAHEALQLADALSLHWRSDVLPPRSALALQHALAEVDDDDLCARMRVLLARSCLRRGAAADAVAHAEAALSGARGDCARSRALTVWATVRYYLDVDDRGLQAVHEQADVLARRAGDIEALADSLHGRMVLAIYQRRDPVAAEALLDEALALWQSAGQPRMVRARLIERAVNWAALGRIGDAVQLLLDCEHSALADGDWLAAGHAVRHLGRLQNQARHFESAAATLKRGLRLGWQRQYAFYIGATLLHLPQALAMTGHAEAAARLQGFALAHWMQVYGALNRTEQRELKFGRRVLGLKLGATRMKTLGTLGQGMSLGEAVAMALGETTP